MLTDEEIDRAYQVGGCERGCECGTMIEEDEPACHVALLSVAKLARDDARTDILREIEAIEETRPAIRENSVIPHLIGIDLGAAHERDRQIAWFVGRSLHTVLRAELEAAAGCDGRITLERALEIVDAIAVSGRPVADNAEAPTTPAG